MPQLQKLGFGEAKLGLLLLRRALFLSFVCVCVCVFRIVAEQGSGMGSRASQYLALRLLQRHFLAPSRNVHPPPPHPSIAAFLSNLWQPESCQPSHHHVAKDRSQTLLQPNFPWSALASLTTATPSTKVQRPFPSPTELPVSQRGASESSEPVWRFKLGLALRSGMYMPAQHEAGDMVASSVKRKRKKKMNKHKQRKLRRRDRHRN